MNIEQLKTQVVKNELVIDKLWNKKCFAINIQYIFNKSEQREFQKIQESVLYETGEKLLVCPPQTLHISLAFVLNVSETPLINKEQLWRSIHTNCLESLRKIADRQKKIRVAFHQILATDKAVIAVAQDKNRVEVLRKEIKQNAAIPQVTQNDSNIIHTTLFRYKDKLENPEIFQSRINTCEMNIPVIINNYKVIKELKYPSLKTETIETLSFNRN